MGARKGFRPPNAGKGRKPGTPNKVTTELKEMILAALDGAGGIQYLQDRAKDSPAAFLTLVGKVLPLQVNASGDIGLKIELVKFADNPPPK